MRINRNEVYKQIFYLRKDKTIKNNQILLRN